MLSSSGGPRPEPGTLTQLFFEAIARFDRPDALRVKTRGQWVPISHREVETKSRRVALALRAFGVRPGDRVLLLSENRPEWAITDYGCLTGRFILVPVYPTLPANQLPFIANDSGAVVAFCSTPAQAEKFAEIRDQVPYVRHVVCFSAPKPRGADLSFDELLERGAADESPETIAAWKRDALAAAPSDLATILYTSGTTGTPKGVMLSHDNLHSNLVAARSIIPFTTDDLSLSFLPLSHSLQRVNDYLAWTTGMGIAYAEFDSVASSMSELHPTFVVGVPRFFEKVYSRVLENALRMGPIKRRIFFWARGVGMKWASVTLAGRTPGPLLALQYRIANALVFATLRERTGGRIRYFVSGSAPLAFEINKFFYAAGLKILEGYGLTETSPVVAVNTPEQFRMGTVGKPIAGCEVRLADDGEILVRGPNVMKGYYNNPTATKESIDADGWFKTGDIGTIEDGFLRITDRKKDLIKTSGGKYVAPQPIEARAKLNKYVNEAVVIGESRKFVSMLIVPNFDHLEKWAAQKGIIWTKRSELIQVPAVREKMEREVASAFEGLASFETPKKIGLLEHEFTLEAGELTPSLKVKRRAIDEHYRDVIDAMYAEPRD